MDERSQKEAVAPLPKVAPRKPRVERVMVMTTPELGPESTWVEKGPADRIQVIKDVQAAKEAFEKPAEDPPKKKEGVLPADAASKIFTF